MLRVATSALAFAFEEAVNLFFGDEEAAKLVEVCMRGVVTLPLDAQVEHKVETANLVEEMFTAMPVVIHRSYRRAFV